MHCKGAGISPVIAGLDPGVTMEWVADRRAKSTGTRSSLWLEHDLFPKARCPPGSSPGQAFSGSCLRACSRSYGIGTWSDACPYWKTGSRVSGTCARTTTGNPLGSVGPRARELDHLGPLLGFFDDEYSKLGRRAAEHRRAQIGKPRLYLGVHKNGVHLLVEAADDLGGRILAQAHGEPLARHVVRHGFADRRDIRQRFKACRGRHRQHAQFARPDVLDHQTETAEINLHLTAEQIAHCGPSPAIGHMCHVDLGHHLEQLASQMGWISAAG